LLAKLWLETRREIKAEAGTSPTSVGALTPRRRELLSVLPHNCGGRLKANAGGAALDR
jgi:hypothetical protein